MDGWRGRWNLGLERGKKDRSDTINDENWGPFRRTLLFLATATLLQSKLEAGFEAVM